MRNQNLTYGNDEYGPWCRFSVGDFSPTLRWCPPGHFMMGSPEDEEERFGQEGPQTEITFTEGFWISDATVSQGLYEAVMGENPSYFAGLGEILPVESVSWYDAQAFMERLNREIPGLTFRLPSEAQWEYACRAGSTTPFEPGVARTYQGQSVTPDEVNFNGNHPYGKALKGEYRECTVPVKGGPFRPNAWGLWHMHGNVWEWCEDIWNLNHEGVRVNGDPRLESEGDDVQDRVVRGGGWFNAARYCRAAFQAGCAPDYWDVDIGFRLVAEISCD